MNNSTNFHSPRFPPEQQYYHHASQQQQQIHGQNYPQATFQPSAFAPEPHLHFSPPFQNQHPSQMSGRMPFASYLPAQSNPSNIAHFSVPPGPFFHGQRPNLTNQPPPMYSFQAPSNTNSGFKSPTFSGFHHYQPTVAPKKTQREIDQEWITNWSQGKRQFKLTLRDNKATLSIAETHSLLVNSVMLLKELSLLKDLLNETIDVDGEEWGMKLRQAWALKKKLQGMEEKLLDLSVLNDLKKKLRKRQTKRVRQKEKRQEDKCEQEKSNTRRQEMHQIMDKHRNAMQEKVLEKKRKREMQAEADNILAEVKRKIHDAKRAQECTKVLEKLRQIRKENSQKKGLHISRESDDSFQKSISDVKELLQKQMSIYETEEKALKVMLESEREEQRELENVKKQQKILQIVSQKEDELSEALFNQNSLYPSHPLYYYWQYYTHAEGSLESLLQIRYQWDAFIAEKDEESACIPVQWIAPSKPSSDLWATVLP